MEFNKLHPKGGLFQLATYRCLRLASSPQRPVGITWAGMKVLKVKVQ